MRGREWGKRRSTTWRCARPRRCVVRARALQCGSGYQGRLCSECRSGYYRIGDTCYKCKEGNTGLLVFLFVAAAFALCGALFWVRCLLRCARVALNGARR